MNEKQKEAFDAVEKINSEIFEKYNKLNEKDKFKNWLEMMPILSITFANEMIFIGLSGVSKGSLSLPELHLYSSLNEDRIYYEKSDKFETFYKYLRRKFNEVKEEIYSIKI